MITDDLQELYKLLRGSRSATSVLDARALIQEKNVVAAHVKLIDARESYMESRSRLLKQDPNKQFAGNSKQDEHNRKVLVRKQEKTLEILKAFEELMPQIERLVKREEAAEAAEEIKLAEEEAADDAPESGIDGVAELDDPSRVEENPGDESSADDESNSDVTVLATPSDFDTKLIAQYRKLDEDKRLDLINANFGFREVSSQQDIYPLAVYLIRTGGTRYLCKTALTAATDSSIELVDLVGEQSLKPFPVADFIEFGQRRKMVLLTKTLSIDDASLGQLGSGGRDDSPSSNDSDKQQHVLDMTAFSQLMTAAQRSGLFSGADQIGHVRDREFRMQDYDLAYQSIEAMHSRFAAAAGQRAQQLTREETDISTGRLKISPKDLQAKRTRDRLQTQEVDRAQRRFQIVLEGLRVLSSR